MGDSLGSLAALLLYTSPYPRYITVHSSVEVLVAEHVSPVRSLRHNNNRYARTPYNDTSVAGSGNDP